MLRRRQALGRRDRALTKDALVTPSRFAASLVRQCDPLAGGRLTSRGNRYPRSPLTDMLVLARKALEAAIRTEIDLLELLRDPPPARSARSALFRRRVKHTRKFFVQSAGLLRRLLLPHRPDRPEFFAHPVRGFPECIDLC
jgi:hypothetical protein